MRITKQIAQDVARQLLAKKYQKISVLEKELKETSTGFYLETVPDKVMIAFETHPEYIQSGTSFYETRQGFNREWFHMTKTLPMPTYSRPHLPEKAYPILRKMFDKISDAKKEYEQTRIELEAALLSLRTYKNVEDKLPEAAQFLPKHGCTALAINFDDLRNKIK